jgi:hypothetical protein
MRMIMQQIENMPIEKLVAELRLLCDLRRISKNSPPDIWPSTRDVANACHMNIYKTRYLLLQLAKERVIEATPGAIGKSLRWRTCDQNRF